jgi:hypothetical protein
MTKKWKRGGDYFNDTMIWDIRCGNVNPWNEEHPKEPVDETPKEPVEEAPKELVEEDNPPKDREVSADRINYIQNNIKNLYIPRNTIKKINDRREDRNMRKKRWYDTKNEVDFKISEIIYHLNDNIFGENFARTKDKSKELLEYCLQNQSNLMAKDILNLELEYVPYEEIQKGIHE